MRRRLTFAFLLITRLAAAQSDYYIRFPDDLFVTDCGTQPLYTKPSTNGANITMLYTDSVSLIVPNACYQIWRRWQVLSPNYDPSLPVTLVPNPNPNADLHHPDNRVGPVVSSSSDPNVLPAPWTASQVALIPGEPLTDFSTFWSPVTNAYVYEQIIQVLDLAKPIVSDCPVGPLLVADSTANDPALWNAPYWFDSFTNSHNLSDGPASLGIHASDDCAGADIQAHYLLFLDLDNNGLFETVVNSTSPPAAGQVNFNNIKNPGYTGGIPQDFDNRLVDAALKYRFGLQKMVIDNQILFAVGWHTEQSPDAWVQPQLPSGTHKIRWIVEDRCGQERICEYLFTVDDRPTDLRRTVRGRVFWDKNENCQADPGEPTPEQWQQVALHHLDNAGQFLFREYAPIDTDGSYQFLVPAGAYSVYPVLPGTSWAAPCNTFNILVNSVGDTTALDFPIRPVRYCPLLQTDIGTSGLHPCTDNTYTVRYCNQGTVTATDAFVRIRLDRFMSFVGASRPAVEEGNRYWRVHLGDLPAAECGSFLLTAHLKCDSTLPGQAYCVEAHIFPDSACAKPTPGIPAFNVGTLEMDGSCAADSVRFILKNIHSTETAQRTYTLFKDAAIHQTGSIVLPPSGLWHLNVPSNGSTWRLETNYKGSPFFAPIFPRQSVTVEACGRNSAGGISTGYLSQLPEADGADYISVDCQQSSDLYDPISKQGYPLGYGSDHLIEQGQPIDYIIRFQNTSSDTVQRVLLRDTLSEWLNSTTVVLGAASHPCRIERSGNSVLNFIFDNIQLPSESDNEAASHGFVKFRVEQNGALPLGAVILNRAVISLDAKPALITLPAHHKIGKAFVQTSAPDWPIVQTQKLTASPNPAPNGAILRFSDQTLTGARFDLYDGLGQRVLSCSMAGNQLDLGAAHLPAGVYFFKMIRLGQVLGVGRLGVL